MTRTRPHCRAPTTHTRYGAHTRTHAHVLQLSPPGLALVLALAFGRACTGSLGPGRRR